MKTCIIIQCRYDSSRLYGKALKPFWSGKTIIDTIHERVSRTGLPVIVATSTEESDDNIVAHCERKGYATYRGSKDDIAGRLIGACGRDYDRFLRVTGDDPFPDVEEMMRLLDTEAEYTYTAGLVRGMDSDCFTVDGITKLASRAGAESIESLEHFKHLVDSKPTYPSEARLSTSDFSLSVDYPNDFFLADAVYKHFGHNNFSSGDVVDLFSRYPSLAHINRLPFLSVYMVHNDYSGWIGEALQSLIPLPYGVEAVLLDYGSTLENLAEIMRFKALGLKVLHYPCKTFVDAVKKAVSECKGKYVMRLDLDDKLIRGALPAMIDYVKQSGCVALYPAYQEIGGREGTINPRERHLPTCAMIDRKHYQYARFVDGQAFRDGTSIYEAIKERGFSVAYTEEPLFLYRRHSKSITGNPANASVLAETDNLIRGAKDGR